MCGIVGRIGAGDAVATLLEALSRLEYRGYDSAGIAVLDDGGQLQRQRVVGKVDALVDSLQQAEHMRGVIGLAHTRWATHGPPAMENAHPHVSGESLGLVHNGIIENHDDLRQELNGKGFDFVSNTDTETIVHQIASFKEEGMQMRQAIQAVQNKLHGSYALGVICSDVPEVLYASCHGSPLVLGVGKDCNYISSDMIALLPWTDRFVFLRDGDVAELTATSYNVYDNAGNLVTLPVHTSEHIATSTSKGPYQHFMLKEIHEQPEAVRMTLNSAVCGDGISGNAFGERASSLLPQIKSVEIAACGSSYHAAVIGSWWLERIAGIPCRVHIASEYRYRPLTTMPDSLFVAVSQSGETADTIAALKRAKTTEHTATMAICNVPTSRMVRETDLVFITRAGPEIGVASTKAFTAQMAAFVLLSIYMAEQRNGTRDQPLLHALSGLSPIMQEALELSGHIEAELAKPLSAARHIFYIGRDIMYPIALEGALKLKEISYIHAEAHPAGELKHGPLAMVEQGMPVVALLQQGEVRKKVLSGMEEIKARGGDLYVIECGGNNIPGSKATISLPETALELQPFVHIMVLQLLAYYVARYRGSDIDQPRNLAKSVTVE